jgi:hypothetical protein
LRRINAAAMWRDYSMRSRVLDRPAPLPKWRRAVGLSAPLCRATTKVKLLYKLWVHWRP